MMILAFTVPLALNMATAVQQGRSPWSTVLTPNGSTTTTYSAGSSTTTWSDLQANPKFRDDFGSGVRGSDCSITSSGSIAVKFDWNPSFGLAPTRNFVQFQNIVETQGAGHAGCSATASNDAESLSASGGPSQSTGIRASKLEYKGFSDGGTLSSSLSGYFSAPGNGGGNGSVSIVPQFTILPGYTIFNHDLEDGGNFKKGANGREANLPTPDGDKELDSVVQFTYNDGLFARTSDELDGRYGFWYNQEHRWNITGDGTPVGDMRIGMMGQAAEFPLFLTLSGNKDDLALNTEIRFAKTVTDASDLASPTIRSRYVVKWHLPYENWQMDGPSSLYVIKPMAEITGRHPGDNPGVGDTFDVKLNYADAWLQDAYTNTATGLDLVSGFLPWPFGGLFNAANIAAVQLRPKDDIDSVNFIYLWGAIAIRTFGPSRSRDSRW